MAKSLNANQQMGGQSPIAELIARGEVPFPTDWPEDQLPELADQVHECRRDQLIRFIAQSIARELCSEDLHVSGSERNK